MRRGVPLTTASGNGQLLVGRTPVTNPRWWVRKYPEKPSKFPARYGGFVMSTFTSTFLVKIGSALAALCLIGAATGAGGAAQADENPPTTTTTTTPVNDGNPWYG